MNFAQKSCTGEKKALPLHSLNQNMVGLAQLVRASDCGSEGHGFEPHIPPQARFAVASLAFFIFLRKNVCKGKRMPIWAPFFLIELKMWEEDDYFTSAPITLYFLPSAMM